MHWLTRLQASPIGRDLANGIIGLPPAGCYNTNHAQQQQKRFFFTFKKKKKSNNGEKMLKIFMLDVLKSRKRAMQFKDGQYK